jgi:5-methylcytosine-specific restriction endonuclease McrA
MVTPMSNKEWAKIKRGSRERVYSQSSISMRSRRCCQGCFASPCIAQCPIQFALAQRKQQAAISRPYNTIIQASQSQIVNTDSTRKAIPKKIRGEAWIKQFGDSTKGSCFCCKVEFGIFDNWHAGHIIAHSNGGKDTADNLRPICGSCNQSMGTENMDAFKARCYPN